MTATPSNKEKKYDTTHKKILPQWNWSEIYTVKQFISSLYQTQAGYPNLKIVILNFVRKSRYPYLHRIYNVYGLAYNIHKYMYIVTHSSHKEHW